MYVASYVVVYVHSLNTYSHMCTETKEKEVTYLFI